MEKLRTNCQGRTGVFQFYITGEVAQSVVTNITKVVLTLNMVVMYLRETIFCNRTVHVGLDRNGDGEKLHEGLRPGKHDWQRRWPWPWKAKPTRYKATHDGQDP